jgi:uncharacterized YccA/Bax inhibitor family protein
MTYDDVIMKTMFCMGVLLAAGVVGWAIPGLALIGTGVAFVLALFAIFKKKVSPPLILAYSAFEGLALGGLSAIYETQYEGIVIQAVLGTVSVFAATLALFKFGNVRATPKMMRILLVAMLGYLLYSVVNLVLVFTGVINTPFGISGMNIPGTSIPVGVVVGVLVVIMAAFNFIVDFTIIEGGVNSGAPASEAWRNAFGLMLTIVWLCLKSSFCWPSCVAAATTGVADEGPVPERYALHVSGKLTCRAAH